MNPLSIIGVFCEDIRQETGGIVTLIGLMPDTVNIESAKEGTQTNETTKENKFLSKLCIFVRANFDPNDSIEEIDLQLVLPDGKELPIGTAEPKVFRDAKAQAKEKKLPLAGIVMQAIMGGFRLPKPGVVRLDAMVDGKRRTLAMLNFQFVDEAISSTEH